VSTTSISVVGSFAKYGMFTYFSWQIQLSIYIVAYVWYIYANT
jgi:hypothetical protein